MHWLLVAVAALLEAVSVSSDCPSGWMAYSNTDLCIKAFNQKMIFVEAMDFCVAVGNGASLVSIHNAFQNVHVASIADEVSPNCNVWIGLYNFDGSSAYSWTDGSTLDYENWAPGYPMSDIEDSMVFLDLSGKNKWVSSYDLTEARCFVCQQKSGQNPPTVSAPTSPGTMTTQPISDCPVGWSYHEGYCYFFEGTEVLHADADAKCAQMNSNMVSITSAAEEAHVESITSGCTYTWIGLASSGGWHWTDGSPLTYTNWESDFPLDYDDWPYAALDLFDPSHPGWINRPSDDTNCVLCKQSLNNLKKA